MSMQSREEALRLDRNDTLASCRDAFSLPDDLIYLDGNSLGPPPLEALDRLTTVAKDEWGRGLIKSWNEAGWIDLPRRCGVKIAPLIGVNERDVLITDSVSINIFKLTGALLKKHDAAIAYEQGEFPTDGYILQGLSALTGTRLIEVTPGDNPFKEENIILVKSAVHYKSAAIAAIADWQERARRANSAIIWDLSHATGVIDLHLKQDGAHYAVGCGYKYLNGGPGAPAFIYVAHEQADGLDQPLSGWMGHAAPFEFANAYRAADGVARFACGTPPVLSLSALDASLSLFNGIVMRALHAKAMALGDFFLRSIDHLGLSTISPGIGEIRGGHICIEHDEGYAVIQALIARGIIGDFRAPNLMRFGFSPLYVRFIDIWDTARALENCLQTEEWKRAEFSVRGKVT